MKNTIFRALIVCGLIAIVAAWALDLRDGDAHAGLDRSNPAADEILGESPVLVEIWFTQEVANEDLIVAVLGPDGSRVDNGDAAVDLCEASRMHVTVTLPAGLPDGEYIVQWQTLSAEDGETDSGSFQYSVDRGSATPVSDESSPAASPESSPVASPAAC
jgi:copper transport protein